jgi:hypothetical protein
LELIAHPEAKGHRVIPITSWHQLQDIRRDYAAVISLAMEIQVVAKNSCSTVGESPHWEEATQSVVYVDIRSGDIHKWNSVTKEDNKIHFGQFLVIYLYHPFELYKLTS